jgi:chromosome segregation ATPase
LKTQLRSKEQGVYGLNQQLAAEKTRADAAERTCRQLQGEVKELTDKNATLTQSEGSLKARLDYMKNNNDELQKEKTALEEKRNQLDRNVKLLNQELSIAKEVSTRKAREWSDLKARYDKTQEENVLLQESEKEIEDLKGKLAEREVNVLENAHI